MTCPKCQRYYHISNGIESKINEACIIVFGMCKECLEQECIKEEIKKHSLK